MSAYNLIREKLSHQSYTWLITGVAGFIGSNLLEELLSLRQRVIGIDNFSTGHRSNLEDVKRQVGESAWNAFTFHEMDICSIDDCHAAVEGVDFVLHQAALGSVPRSIENPILTHQSNIDGFLNMLVASRDAGVRRFVYAASSSTYGDNTELPKVEDRIGKPLSPYAVTKFVNELYADVFARTYGQETIGLRYFNVFGPRQDPLGAYAAVIPLWIESLQSQEPVYIHGDGETSRDFCFINNTVQANILAAISENRDSINKVYNVAVGEQTSLNELFLRIRDFLSEFNPAICEIRPEYDGFRSGDVRHSLADISKARSLLAYSPTHTMAEGLSETCQWFQSRRNRNNI